MKKLFTLIVCLYLTVSLAAQFPVGGAAGANRQAPPSIGRVYGKLVDSTGKGIRDASVVVLQNRMDSATKKMKEVLLKGVTTAGNGDFNLEGLPIFGALKLSISAVGFQPVTQTVRFEIRMPVGATPVSRPQGGQMPDLGAMASNFEKDLGNVTLAADEKAMQGVVVTATSTRMRMDIDKKVFNVSQNLVSTGGTAVDVMKNVPSVNVDIDGNVTLRNASPQLYIDGRPTTLTLDQIPADAIESVEVITNPSAKYDASGGNAGIINIVLKKNKRTGYNGTVNAGVDKRGGVNGGANLSVRTNKINVSVAGFGNQMRNRSTSSTALRSLLTNPGVLIEQSGRTNMKGGFLFGRGGLDYFVTNRTTLSLSYTKVHGEFNPSDILRTDSSLTTGQYLSYSERRTSNQREFNAHGFTGGFKYLFPKKGEEWTGDFNIFSGKNNNNSLYTTDVYNSQSDMTRKGIFQQRIIGSGTNQFTTLQTDYVNPIGTSAKLELGARVQLRELGNNMGNYRMNIAGEFVPIPSSSSNYKSNEHVYAAYVNFSNSVKNFGYQLGLRGERSDYTGDLTETKETFTNKYPLSLFPSVFLSQKLNSKQELQLSYTRRINRPFFMQIIPFIDSSDVTNLTRGNAGLRPEFTNALEMSYSKTYKGNNTFLASVYYKYSTDLITRYLDSVTIGSNKRLVTTFVNANSSRSVGFELTTQNTLTKWWDMNANFNLYNSKINTANIASGATQQDPLWSYFAKMNSSFKLPKKFKFQLSGTYQSKTNLPVNQGGGLGPGGGGPPMGSGPTAAQGYIRSNWGMDLALQKSFLKNDAASLTFNVSDVFRTRRFDQYSESSLFVQNTHRLGDVPMFRLNFSYRFGQMDLSMFKRKNTRADQEGQQGAMQGMGQ